MPIAVLDSQLNTALSGTITGASASVPIPFVVAINGRTYVEDLEFKPWKRQAMRSTTTQTTRTQADTSNEPGEQSLSTESLWRRTQDSWHLGAGQVFLDRKNSQEFQFRQSKGVNPWVQWQLTLLNDTTLGLSSTNTNLDLVVCGGHLYVIDGQALKFSTNGTSWTTVTGTPAVTASSICSDGHTVWVAYGASGIYSTTEGAATASQYVTSALTATAIVAFVLGRLMVANNQSIYNVTGSGALPTALFTSNYTNFAWVGFTEGNGVIFAAGNSGNRSQVYSIQINTDATALSAPIVCGQLPYGETINTVYGYAGSGVAIGTSLGFRFAEQALANGVAGTVSLTIGPLFLSTTSSPAPGVVRTFAGYGRFIYGNWDDYDASSTGLFRMDPSQFIADLAPAYASDLMASTQGNVNSVVVFNGAPVFSVNAVGVYVQAATYVASGTIDSGLITYGLADNKLPVFLDLTFNALMGTIQSLVAYNGTAFVSAGSATQANSTFVELNLPQNLTESIEIRETLNAGSSNTTTPTLTRHTLRSVPAPATPTDWTVVIQLRERCLAGDVEFSMVPSQEWAYLDNLRETKQICTLQLGNMGPFTTTLESIDYIPEEVNARTGEFQGVGVLTMRTVV